MKKQTFLVFILLLFGLAVNAQKDLTVSPVAEERMSLALQKALATPEPSWCSTPELKELRRILIEKCIRTLYHNYLPVRQDIFHEGVMPAVTQFDGLWAWDSWKHAYALAGLDKELAENSIRAMYDYQDSTGMIADCIFPDKKENNYRDTKPPLSAWAVNEIFNQTRDTLFLREIYPALLKYHYWWYSYRDHDQNGLCEYGSVDNTLQAARWESGWDNAIRFDDAHMLKNGNAAYSMNIESVDLNAYLYLEKQVLIRISGILGDRDSQRKLEKEALKLKRQLQTLFFDPKTGFFYDLNLEDKSFVLSKEASGWIPLFAGIATRKQAEKVREHMLNEQEFNTFIPLPTASRDNAKFNPEKGYWRGPVWIDQFYYGYQGLRNYGFASDANALLIKLLKNAEGMMNDEGSLRENYDPVTGKGLNAKAFSWTAAMLLVMMTTE